MDTTIAFRERSDTITITMNQGFSSIKFDIQCNSVDEAKEIAINSMIAIANDFFENKYF